MLKIFKILIVLAVIILAFFVFFSQREGEVSVTETGEGAEQTTLSITTLSFNEENFSGQRPQIVGKSILADAGRDYIDKRIAEFKRTADLEVPGLREKFGADNATFDYSIEIDARTEESESTKSLILSEYAYTGGASGNQSYRTFTALSAENKIIPLSHLVPADKQTPFTALVKEKLLAWRPEGNPEPVVFEDEVNALTFASFTNWSLTDENLTIYFDKYAIGPGSLGAVAWAMPVSEAKEFLH
ncbi:hypothetical protein A3G06_02600 [Candidatus Nomurabacteria bacterium RIFCSPLOWO2_12_FULL_46_14]|uniref:DUF3298 domain-containing protein n=1 Tax=Candidatus Nomurabacteria bacterium RIFCSPLOWO2_12_FULL_46_14 TaxID=1801797 RepID=A0A1F6Y860_9BACT|nr:MAG: hypothetical protein A3G06_02600 [Candidatus Nomurabacteria bacterium RIFCSPLOWO2_12_FULL_46_14]